MCMQKINLITQLFLKMLQTNSKLVIFDNLRMPGYTHLKCNLAIWRNLWGSFVGKISSSFSRFPWDITKICKLILGTLGMTGYANPKWYYQLVETFRVHLQAKNQVHPPQSFLEILQRYWNFLFWVLWARLIEHTQNTQNDSINL